VSLDGAIFVLAAVRTSDPTAAGGVARWCVQNGSEKRPGERRPEREVESPRRNPNVNDPVDEHLPAVSVLYLQCSQSCHVTTTLDCLSSIPEPS
jgi:hypothetical protein